MAARRDIIKQITPERKPQERLLRREFRREFGKRTLSLIKIIGVDKIEYGKHDVRIVSKGIDLQTPNQDAVHTLNYSITRSQCFSFGIGPIQTAAAVLREKGSAGSLTPTAAYRVEKEAFMRGKHNMNSDESRIVGLTGLLAIGEGLVNGLPAESMLDQLPWDAMIGVDTPAAQQTALSAFLYKVEERLWVKEHGPYVPKGVAMVIDTGEAVIPVGPPSQEPDTTSLALEINHWEDKEAGWLPYPHAPEVKFEKDSDPRYGILSEKFVTTLDGRPIDVRVYSKPVDNHGGKWVLFTSVDANTGKVINSEMSPQ